MTIKIHARIAIIIPAYNEQETIAATIRDFADNLPEAELWVIDNASEDKTNEIARKEIQTLGIHGGVISEPCRGKSNAMRRAFSSIEADAYIMVDADSTYSASDIHRLLAPVLEGRADMVVGNRHAGGTFTQVNSRRFHGFGNTLVRRVINVLFKSNDVDILSGYRAFSARFVLNFPILCEGFELETEMTLFALNRRLRVIEIPVAYAERPQGSISKLHTITDGFRVLLTIVRILKHYQPLLFFGACAMLSALASLTTGSVVILEYLETHFIARVPMAILATGLAILAMIFLTIAIVLDTVTRLHRENFELYLLRRHRLSPHPTASPSQGKAPNP